MRQLRNLLTTDGGQKLSDLAVILLLIAIVVFVVFVFLGGEVSPVSRGVGSSV